MTTSHPITGYAEGYYGRLLSWTERAKLVESANNEGWNTYLYAPKDDALHRSAWRTPYPDTWRNSFRQFSNTAQASNVEIIAGIAPGLDFDFADIKNGADFNALSSKALQLLSDGATGIALMFDDIDAGFTKRAGHFEFEGIAHATLANRLQEILVAETQQQAVNQNRGPLCYCVPRIYANELVEGSDPALLGDGDIERNRRYLNDFLSVLDDSIAWFYCGDAIVSRQPVLRDSEHLLPAADGAIPGTYKHRGIIWDNFFANDYCPRRLFLGPWSGREGCTDILINPTGLPATDTLIMTMVTRDRMLSKAHDESSWKTHSDARLQTWYNCLSDAGVPDAFRHISHYFESPTFSSECVPESNGNASPINTPTVSYKSELTAIDELLWRWKSPLALEWYPFLMGLKQDLMMGARDMSALRIRKLQTAPLAERLIGRD